MPAVVTPQDIISLALKDAGVIGVGQTPLAEDTNDAFKRLNWMLDQWAVERWLVWRLVDVACTSTGAQSYSIGPGADFDTPIAPDRLEAAFLRQLIPSQPNQIDYPLQVIEARETYNDIALKSLVSFPEYIWLDNAYPEGRVYPWPVPQATIYAVHVSIKAPLLEFANLTDPITFRPEYFAALHTNLAVILRDAYDLPPKEVLIRRAKVSLNVMRKANQQIPRLKLDTALLRPSIYNIFSDQVR